MAPFVEGLVDHRTARAAGAAGDADWFSCFATGDGGLEFRWAAVAAPGGAGLRVGLWGAPPAAA